jgi:uncharacterized membrane-anchored protein
MREDHVPSIGPRFWVLVVVASVAGANLGDLLTVHVALGFAARMLVLAALLAAIFIGERYDRSRTEAWYWAVVVVIQAASTKLADFSVIDLGFGMGLGRLALVAGLAVLLTATFWVLRSSTMLFISTHMLSRPGGTARPLTDAAHWTAMVLASTLGAAASDFFSIGLGLGPLRTAMILAATLAATFNVYRLPIANRLFAFWLTNTAIRAFATAVGDLLVGSAPLVVSTAINGAMLVALLVLWPKPRLRA